MSNYDPSAVSWVVSLWSKRLRKNTRESLMIHTIPKKWFAITLAVLAFLGSANAATNDLNGAYKAALERAIGLINTRGPERSDKQLVEAVICIEALEKSGDRSLLPYLEEKSLNTANPEIVRDRSASAYVNIADMEETVAFMKKMNAAPSVKGTSWLYFLNKQILGKFAAEEKKMDAGTKEKFFSCLLNILQSSNDACEVQMMNLFLLERMPEYANSKQRATMNRYANTGNDWVTNTFYPIKAHFDKIPPSKRTDLRKRFPELPPLPEDKNAGTLKTVLAIAVSLAAFIAVCVTIWIRAKRWEARGRS
jgi:hypothetical protein